MQSQTELSQLEEQYRDVSAQATAYRLRGNFSGYQRKVKERVRLAQKVSRLKKTIHAIAIADGPAPIRRQHAKSYVFDKIVEGCLRFPSMTRAELAAALGVNESSVKLAKRVVRKGIADQVIKHRITKNGAQRILERPDILQKIKAGEITAKQALEMANVPASPPAQNESIPRAIAQDCASFAPLLNYNKREHGVPTSTAVSFMSDALLYLSKKEQERGHHQRALWYALRAREEALSEQRPGRVKEVEEMITRACERIMAPTEQPRRK